MNIQTEEVQPPLITTPRESKLVTTKPERARVFRGMVYGPYGSGKTYLAAGLNDDPRTAPTLFLDFEGGLSSIAGRDIDVVQIRSWETYTEVFNVLQSGDHPYKSIVIDSISETHVFALFTILEQEGGKRRNPDLIEQGDYGTASVQLRRLVREFRDLDLHLLITALEREETDAREGVVKKPALSGRLADEVPGLMDVVGYMGSGTEKDTGETVRVLILQNYPKIRSKVRVPDTIHAPNEIVSPTITKVLDVLGY